jgi:hypothetical protein
MKGLSKKCHSEVNKNDGELKGRVEVDFEGGKRDYDTQHVWNGSDMFTYDV